MSDSATSDARPRVIIADDDPVVRSMLDMSLGRQFDVVGIAQDGEEAVELARLRQPDAAVVDVEMPKGGGLRAVRGIADVAPNTAIVVLSGDESDSLVRELIQAGAATYKRKGADPRELAESVVESIRAHAADGRRSESPAA